MFKNNQKPIIAMLYLPPSLGHVDFVSMDSSIQDILSDLKIIEDCGFDAVLLENEKDAPYKSIAESEDISSLSIYTHEVVRNTKLPVGFNFLLNDPISSLSIASASKADFIRTDYFSDEMMRESDGKLMKVNPKSIIEHRKNISSLDIKIYADVQVKHATLVNQRPLEDSIYSTISDGADGIIISGNWTGSAPDLNQLQEIQELDINCPVIIGSGFDSENASTLLPLCSGVIVGSSILTNGRNDKSKCEKLMNSVLRVR